MRARFVLFASLALLGLIPDQASGQSDLRRRRSPTVYFHVMDGIGVSSGGSPIGGSGLAQMFRAGVVAQLFGDRGMELSAMRIQELVPPSRRFNDPEANPETDGIMLSYAAFNPQRGGGFPSVLTIGGGIVKRPTSNPAVDKNSWGFQVGYDSDLTRLRVNWADLSAGARFFVTTGGANDRVYMAALTLGIRIG